MTRHNAGSIVVDDISNAFGIALDKNRRHIRFGRGNIGGSDIILAQPMAFVNRSGLPVQELAHFFKIPSADLIVIHDDIDLVYGRLKVKARGGHGGHKGIESIITALGSDEFPRLRIGVGRPVGQTGVVQHVLGRFSADEMPLLEKIVAKARETVCLLLREGPEEVMNQINSRKLFISNTT